MQKTICLNIFRKVLALIFIFCFIAPAYIQAKERCGFDLLHKKLMQTDPSYRSKRLQSERHLQKILNRKTVKSTPDIYKIPVVVHVMHLGEAVGTGSNISAAQIDSAITVLNEDFRKMAGTNGDGNGEDVRIEFGLAVRDPNNQPSSGIVRIDTSSAGSGDSSYADYGVRNEGALGLDESDLKDLSRWDNDRFYNIWIVTEIDNNDGGDGTQGYAYFPGAPPTLDGALIIHPAFGTVGTAAGAHNRTATHEMGHAFNLYHTFQGDEADTRCPLDLVCGESSDCCDDTPPHRRSHGNCPENLENPCAAPDLLGLVVHNYMDYSSDLCQSEFTLDQKDRMRAIFTQGGLRESLKDSNGLTPVGAPMSDFSATTPTCAGDVTFQDKSTDGPTSWAWTFTGGTPSSSTDRNPTVTYTKGLYSVSLTATNSVGAGYTETKTDYLYVYDSPVPACAVTTTDLANNFGMGIYNVTFDAIDNTTGDAVDDTGYLDFSCSQIATLVPGNSYPISVTTGPINNEDVRVYIDYNNNGVFNLPEELAFSSEDTLQTHFGTVNTPDWVVTGSILRMRVISDFSVETIDPCTNQDSGQTEDYGVVFTAVSAPVSDFSADNTILCTANTVNFTNLSANGSSGWSWSFSGGDPSTSTANAPSVDYDTAGAYDVSLTVTNAAGTGNTETKTGYIAVYDPPVSACTVTTTDLTNNYGMGIYNVNFESIDNITGDAVTDGGYQDFSCSRMAGLEIGGSYPITVTTGPANDEDVRVYIDYNNNGVFDLPDELAFSSDDTGQTHSGTIVIPSDAAVGSLLRMRVISDADFNTINPCTDQTYGQAEDYAVLIRFAAEMPVVSTTAATSITYNSASSGGNVTDDGGASVTARGVCWSTNVDPTTDDMHTTDAAGTGMFTSFITDLDPDTLYHYRAYATNSSGTSYGADMTFTTDPQAPTITTQAASDVTPTTATVSGNITDLGAPNPTQHGVCWSTSVNPTTADSKTEEGAAGSTGAFTSIITGLSPGAIYHYRAYATNTAGTSYGLDVILDRPSAVYGDINNDNIVNLADAICALRIMVKLPVPTVNKEKTLGNEKKIRPADAVFILQVSAMLIP